MIPWGDQLFNDYEIKTIEWVNIFNICYFRMIAAKRLLGLT